MKSCRVCFFFLKKEDEVFPGRVNFEVSMAFFNPKPAQHAVHTIPEFNARFATNQAQTSQHGPLATWSVKSKLVQEDNTKKITATNAWTANQKQREMHAPES
jgi:hypothetical protein